MIIFIVRLLNARCFSLYIYLFIMIILSLNLEVVVVVLFASIHFFTLKFDASISQCTSLSFVVLRIHCHRKSTFPWKKKTKTDWNLDFIV